MSDLKPGWVWLESKPGGWRPFLEFREIRKGKNAGKFEVLLPPQKPRKIIVERGAIRSFPVDQNLQLKFKQSEPPDAE